MSDELEWLPQAEPQDRLGERSFVLNRAESKVPGVLWLPAAAPSVSLILLGHGGSGHKHDDRVERLGRWFAKVAGIAAVAIDGPYHGDRAPGGLVNYQDRIAGEGVEVVIDRMTRDWTGTLQALELLGVARTDRLGYLGLSMGTRFGVALAGELGSRLHGAVFGKFGLEQSVAMHAGLDASEKLAAAARQVTAPVLFHVQWDDEIFPRSGQFALFDELASADKRLIARTGRHAAIHPDDEPSWRDFLVTRLRAEKVD